jgi:PAS domain S-box-containing protein
VRQAGVSIGRGNLIAPTSHDTGVAAAMGLHGGVESRRYPSDTVAVRVVARIRVATAIGIAATGSFLPHLSRHSSLLFDALGLVWVPWACVVLFAADQEDNRLARLGGPVGDLIALFALQAFLPGSANGVLLGYLIVVAFAIYTAGRAVGAALSALTLLLILVAQLLATNAARISTTVIAPFSLTLIALVFLFDRTVTLQLRATARSERLQSQADAILARVADAVVVTDSASRVIRCNPSAGRLIGMGESQVAGLSCADALALHGGERMLDCRSGCALLREAEMANAVLSDGTEGSLGIEVWRYDAAGRRQPLLANASAVLDAGGRLVEVVHSIRDITRIKQAEEAKTLFLATTSHELKTPLTVIRGFAETLLTHPDLDGAQVRQALEAVHLRAQELTRIVDRLLLSSRIEAGRAQVTLSEVLVEPLAGERIDAMRGATGRVIRFEVVGPVAPVVADPSALVTVIDHLLDNAVKYSPDGGPITVTVGAAGERALLAVHDQGIGMDDEQVEHCFDKFWQAESTDVRRFGGTGIGLYIVRSLVDAMGGQVSVTSAPGRGSCFTVSLAVVPSLAERTSTAPGGERSMIREFMRQIGVAGPGPSAGATPR